MTGRAPLRLRVEAPAAPRPGLLKSAIADRLAGRPVAGAAEDAVARAVVAAVAAHRLPKERP
jgi:formaldehyde-activating enzyme involved in methanogenesis